MDSGLCRKIGFILSCMSLTLAPEKLFTWTLSFWDSRPGCRPETIESPAMQIPFGYGQSSLLSDVTLSFLSASLMQIGDRMDSSLSCVFAELPLYCKYFSWFFFSKFSHLFFDWFRANQSKLLHEVFPIGDICLMIFTSDSYLDMYGWDGF